MLIRTFLHYNIIFTHYTNYNQNDNIYLSFEVYNNLVKKLKEEKLKKAAAKNDI